MVFTLHTYGDWAGLVRDIFKQVAHTFPIVGSSYSFCKHHRDVDHLDLAAVHHVLVLGDGVGHYDGLEAAIIDPGESLPTEDAVCQDGVYLRSSILHKLLCSLDYSSASVCHVIDQDGHLPLGIPHQDHAGDLISFLPFFVNESKIYVETISDGGHPLGSSSIRRHHDG